MTKIMFFPSKIRIKDTTERKKIDWFIENYSQHLKFTLTTLGKRPNNCTGILMQRIRLPASTGNSYKNYFVVCVKGSHYLYAYPELMMRAKIINCARLKVINHLFQEKVMAFCDYLDMPFVARGYGKIELIKVYNFYNFGQFYMDKKGAFYARQELEESANQLVEWFNG